MVPEGWRSITLEDTAQRAKDSFVDGPFGSNLKTSDYADSGVPLIQLQNIGEGEFKPERRNCVPLAKAIELRRHQAVPGDVVIAKMAAPVARACRVPTSDPIWLVVADCMRLRVDEDRYDAAFVAAAINGPTIRKQAEAQATGSTRKRINLTKMKALSFGVPPLAEQKKIAEILQSVDDAIAKTQAVIDQTEKVKKGLLQELLTRGMPGRHTRFKMTEIGEIPADWEVVRLSRLARMVTSGSRGWAKFYHENGALFVRSQNIKQGFLDFSDEQRVSLPRDVEGARTRLAAGDLLITITGNSVGNASLVPEGLGEAYVSQHVGLVRLNEPGLAELAALFFSPAGPGNSQLVEAQYGQSKPGLNLTNLRNFLMPVPTEEERTALCAQGANLDVVLSRQKSLLTGLSNAKRGIMDDLLTGRVRVKV